MLVASDYCASVSSDQHLSISQHHELNSSTSLTAPSQPTAHKLLAIVVHNLLMLQAAPRVLFMRAYAHLFEGRPSGLNILNVLRSNPHLTALRAAINQAVIDDFSAAREAVRVGQQLQDSCGK
jgi:hypothetical protein